MSWEVRQNDDRIDALLGNLKQLTTAIEACIQVKLQVPTLILIYSSIDIMGYLNMPFAKQNNSCEDFCQWADSYFIPNLSNKACNSLDLYSARCGLLHSMSHESNLTRKQAAKSILYAWGNYREGPLQQILKESNRTDIVLHVDDMSSALRKGLQHFLRDITADDDKLTRVLSRAGKMFTSIQIPE